MIYSFIENKLNSLIENETSKKANDDDMLHEFKEDQRYKFTIIAFVIIEIVYIGYVLYFPIELPSNLSFQLYYVIAAFTVILIFLIVIIKTKRNKRLQICLKYIAFLITYGNQLFWAINTIITGADEFRVIRNFYILQLMVNFYAVWFFKFTYYVVGFVACCNCALIIWFQIVNKYSHLYLSEIIFSLLTPIAAFISRREYEGIILKLYSNMKTIRAFSSYIDSLINQLPCFYFTFSAKKIVYMNQAFLDFISKNHELTTQKSQSPDLENLINMETSNPITNEHYRFAQRFLSANVFSYIDPSIKTCLETKCNFTGQENIIDILSALSEDKADLKLNHFFFLGINESCKEIENVKLQFSFHLRKMTSRDTSWMEVIMTDVTLSQKRKLIESIYTMRENLLSKIAHEFKTPLLCISGLAEEICDLLGKNENTSALMKMEKKKSFDVKNLSNYTLFLIHDVINFLKPKKSYPNKIGNLQESHLDVPNENKQIVIKNEQFHLMDILSFCFDILKTLLKYSKDKLRYIEPFLESDIDCIIVSDSFRLKQILLNLISNAVKFTKNGYIKIQVNVENNSSSIVINIIDTGIGINEENLRTIFSEEKMLESHIKENELGSGLGLSISKQISNLCGFPLTVKSKENYGSTFSLTIPINTISIVYIKDFKRKSSNCNSNMHNESSTSSIHTYLEPFADFHPNLQQFIKKSYSNQNNGNESENISKYILIIDDNDLILNSIESLLRKSFAKYNKNDIGIGDWGLGIGDWGLGIGPNPQSPIPNCTELAT